MKRVLPCSNIYRGSITDSLSLAQHIIYTFERARNIHFEFCSKFPLLRLINRESSANAEHLEAAAAAESYMPSECPLKISNDALIEISLQPVQSSFSLNRKSSRQDSLLLERHLLVGQEPVSRNRLPVHFDECITGAASEGLTPLGWERHLVGL